MQSKNNSSVSSLGQLHVRRSDTATRKELKTKRARKTKRGEVDEDDIGRMCIGMLRYSNHESIDIKYSLMLCERTTYEHECLSAKRYCYIPCMWLHLNHIQLGTISKLQRKIDKLKKQAAAAAKKNMNNKVA